MEVSGPSYLLREAAPPAGRDGALWLLEAAGWSPGRLAHWATSGTLLELYDPADAIPCGAAIVAPMEDATYALRAWATTLDTADRAVAGRLVRAIADALRRSGARRVVASVDHADRRSITLLLEAGFRICDVDRAGPPYANDGSCDPAWDLVLMDQEL